MYYILECLKIFFLKKKIYIYIYINIYLYYNIELIIN